MQHRTVVSVRMLQSVAVVVSLAVIFWSLGLPTFRIADAANLTTLSNTLSNSDPGALSDHEIDFTTPTGVAAGESIILTFPVGFNISTSGATSTDMDLEIEGGGDETLTGDNPGVGEWQVTITDQVVTFTSGGAGATLAANATATIKIGDNADGGAGNTQVTNANTAKSYEFDLVVGSSDSGSTRVALIDNVDVTASVDTIFTFSVSGVAGNQSVNGTTTTGTSTSNAIDFGELDPGVATTSAQDLVVSTNATQGYVVTVQQSQNLLSSTGADIDGFVNGSNTNTPTTWVDPTPDVTDENTWGHWGITSDDATTTRAVQFGSEEFVSASTTPIVVMGHDGPSDGSTPGAGTARVGYSIVITSLQEAGDDYSTTLTYIATPTF